MRDEVPISLAPARHLFPSRRAGCPGCSTSWPCIRLGPCRSATRTAYSALNGFRPAPTWETETCFCSSWTATAISTTRPTRRTLACSADSFSGTATSVPPPSPWMCSCSARSAAITSSGASNTWSASGAGTWVRRFRTRGRRRSKRPERARRRRRARSPRPPAGHVPGARADA